METFHNNVMLGESGTYSTNWEEYHTYLKQLIIEANFSIKEPNNIEYITSLSDANSNVYLGFANSMFCVVKQRHFVLNKIPIYVAKEIFACLKKTSRTCLGISLTTSDVYFVFEYIPNTLSSFVNMDLQLPNEVYKHICIGILRAVQRLHSMGYAHRDIKIENLCIRVNGEVVLIDMDSIGLLKNNGNIRPICTIKTRAPEVIMEGSFYNNEKLDAWSTGMTMLRICTHELFNNSTDFKTQTSLLCKIDKVLEKIKNQDSKICILLKKRDLYGFACTYIFPLIEKDPKTRISVLELLENDTIVRKALS